MVYPYQYPFFEDSSSNLATTTPSCSQTSHKALFDSKQNLNANPLAGSWVDQQVKLYRTVYKSSPPPSFFHHFTNVDYSRNTVRLQFTVESEIPEFDKIPFSGDPYDTAYPHANESGACYWYKEHYRNQLMMKAALEVVKHFTVKSKCYHELMKRHRFLSETNQGIRRRFGMDAPRKRRSHSSYWDVTLMDVVLDGGRALRLLKRKHRRPTKLHHQTSTVLAAAFYHHEAEWSSSRPAVSAESTPPLSPSLSSCPDSPLLLTPTPSFIPPLPILGLPPRQAIPELLFNPIQVPLSTTFCKREMRFRRRESLSSIGSV